MSDTIIICFTIMTCTYLIVRAANKGIVRMTVNWYQPNHTPREGAEGGKG